MVAKRSRTVANKTTGPTTLNPEVLLGEVFDRAPQKVAECARAVSFPNGLDYIRFKFELANVGSVEIELSGRPEAAVTEDADLYDPISLADREPCVPANARAKAIIASCEAAYTPTNQADCNKFLKDAIAPYFPGIFGGLTADQIVGQLRDSAQGWNTGTSIADCIKRAQAGDFVIAGLTSKELGDKHGHVAVVVGCPPEDSAEPGQPAVKVPIGYAGSMGGRPIRGARLTGTFRAALVRQENVSYFWKTPTVR